MEAGLDVIESSPRVTRARETLRLYAGDWAAFTEWCRAARRVALPAHPLTVAAYLDVCAATLSHGALARRVAAIAAEHRRRGLPSPTPDSAIKTILCRVRAARTPRRGKPPTPAQLIRMAIACPGDLAGQRDRALLLLAATGFGSDEAQRRPGGGDVVMRSALLALDAEDIRFKEGGMEIAARAGPDDADRRVLSVPSDTDRIRCPVRAMEDWLRASDSRFGPVFRKVDRWGNVEHRRLGTDAIRRILERRAPSARKQAKGGHARRLSSPGTQGDGL